MRAIRFVLPLLLTTVAGTLPAQSAVLKLPGKSVEVIGLRRWTIPMLQDSLGKYTPDRTLDSHGCAEALRYHIGFADAGSTRIRMAGDSIERIVITVVEPQDSALVRFRPTSRESGPPRQEWSAVGTIAREKPLLIQIAVSEYLNRSPGGVPRHLRRDSASILTIWNFLDQHRSRTDARLARRTLLNGDPNLTNRVIAGALLINFPESDSTWWALVETMREVDGPARGVAALVLEQLALHKPRAVNWAPVAPTIDAMLNGTSVAMLSELIQVLNLTGVRKEWAAPFLRSGGRMLLAYAGAEHEIVRRQALRLLQGLSGLDFGSDVSQWKRWVGSLRAA